MQAPEIKLEIARIVPHAFNCKSHKGEECSCSHEKVVDELDAFVFQLLRRIR